MKLSTQIAEDFQAEEEKSEGPLSESYRELRLRDHADAIALEKIAADLADQTNHHDAKFVLDALFPVLAFGTHRYLQGEIGQVIIGLIERYAALAEGEYDGRNELFVKVCRQLVSQCDILRRLPTIDRETRF